MDKAVLKKFAIESRQDLMQRMENKIKTFYIDEEFSKQQSGDVYILANSKHSLNLSKEEYIKRELLIKRINELGLDQVIEEAAYTWFNRIVAIRYMEIHDYLPLTRNNQSLGIRVLSSKDNTPDPEIMKFTNLVNPELDIDFKKEKYVELKDDNEKFKYILLLVCKKLGRVIPQVFDGITDYIDILIPDNLLNESGFVNKIITEVSEENYEQVEIIGWLYQYWNTDIFNSIYDGDMTKKKIEPELLPAATQLFTPDWCVQYMVDNTLGRLIIEHNKDEHLLNDLQYFVDKQDIVDSERIDPKNIKFLDPCCGSGHILVYALDIFYKAYENYGYPKNEIISNILSNNLYGIDIDERAWQLAILAVLLKAYEYDKNIFKNVEVSDINIIKIRNTKNIDRALIDTLPDSQAKDEIMNLIEIFTNGENYGSLTKVNKFNFKEIEKLVNSSAFFGYEVKKNLMPLIKQAKILCYKYDIVVTNPPYLSNGRMNAKLSDYVKKNYPMSRYDLSSVFLDKSINEFLKENGYLSFITTKSWMYLQRFEDIRKYMIENKQFISIVDYGTELFDGKIGHLPIVSWVTKNCKPNQKLIAIKLSDYCYSRRDEKKVEFFNSQNYYFTNQLDFVKIPGYPIAYWVSDSIGKIYNTSKKVFDYGVACVGLQTSDNNRFLRKWFEVSFKKIGHNFDSIDSAKKSSYKWFPYNKGGGFRRWYGNGDDIVNWENNGEEIRKYNEYLNSSRSSSIGIANTQYYFKESGTWGLVSNNFSVRYSPQGAIFDTGGSSVFINNGLLKYIIGFFNTLIAQQLLLVQNPTLNFQPGNVSNLPIIVDNRYKNTIEQIVDRNIELVKEDWDSFETSWDFIKHPLIEYKEGSGYDRECDNWKYKIKDAYESWKSNCDEKFKLLKNNEEELNRIFINIYNLNNEFKPDVEDKDITIRKADRLREIKSLISYAVGCMFGRYSLDKNGLIYAGGEFDESRYKKFKVDPDNIIPITDETYFDDDIVQRFKKFIEVAFGKETLNENLDFIAETLGKKGTETSEETIRRYFVNDFFNDHCKIYQKRPIYWLLDSGKKNGFKALIYMHRYNENLIPKARLDYLHRIQTTYEKILSDVNYKLTTDLSMIDKKESLKKQADLNAKLQEIKEYDEKIAHIANQRISIDLDDGVKENYEKFKDILAKIK